MKRVLAQLELKWKVLDARSFGEVFFFRKFLEPPAGIEPATCGLRNRRSTN